MMLASLSTITGSFPPHSSTVGIIRSAADAATFFAVRVEPVKAILSTSELVSAAPVAASPVTTWKISANGATSAKVSPSHCPTPGVYSLGLKTMVLPAANEYAIDPIGVKTG